MESKEEPTKLDAILTQQGLEALGEYSLRLVARDIWVQIQSRANVCILNQIPGVDERINVQNEGSR